MQGFAFVCLTRLRFYYLSTLPSQQRGKDNVWGRKCLCLCSGVVLGHLVMCLVIMAETYSVCRFTQTYGVSGLFFGSHEVVACVGFVSKCCTHVPDLTILLIQYCFVGLLCYATPELFNAVEFAPHHLLHICWVICIVELGDLRNLHSQSMCCIVGVVFGMYRCAFSAKQNSAAHSVLPGQCFARGALQAMINAAVVPHWGWDPLGRGGVFWAMESGVHNGP
jgi:hypothetical protein